MWCRIIVRVLFTHLVVKERELISCENAGQCGGLRQLRVDVQGRIGIVGMRGNLTPNPFPRGKGNNRVGMGSLGARWDGFGETGALRSGAFALFAFYPLEH